MYLHNAGFYPGALELEYANQQASVSEKKNRIGIIQEFILGCILEGFPQAQKNNCAWVISAHQYPKWKLFGNTSVKQSKHDLLPHFLKIQGYLHYRRNKLDSDWLQLSCSVCSEIVGAILLVFGNRAWHYETTTSCSQAPV